MKSSNCTVQVNLRDSICKDANPSSETDLTTVTRATLNSVDGRKKGEVDPVSSDCCALCDGIGSALW